MNTLQPEPPTWPACPWHRNLLRRNRRRRLRQRPARACSRTRCIQQVALHEEYGGVVPELASRDHVRKLLPLTAADPGEAGLRRRATSTASPIRPGPGLVGALLVGAGVADALAWALDMPAIGVHHMEGHLLAPLLEAPDRPPFVALLVSGGHTQLIAVDGVGRYALLGETLDDAAGEAFDKTAKLMGLPYPGRPGAGGAGRAGPAGRLHAPAADDRPAATSTSASAA